MSQVRGPQPQYTRIGHIIRTDEGAGLDTKGRAGGPVFLFWRACPFAWQGGLIVEAPPFFGPAFPPPVLIRIFTHGIAGIQMQ